jgi:hypothetical protein
VSTVTRDERKRGKILPLLVKAVRLNSRTAEEKGTMSRLHMTIRQKMYHCLSFMSQNVRLEHFVFFCDTCLSGD